MQVLHATYSSVAIIGSQIECPDVSLTSGWRREEIGKGWMQKTHIWLMLDYAAYVGYDMDAGATARVKYSVKAIAG